MGWRVPLSFGEAVSWVKRGHAVEMLVEGHFFSAADKQNNPEIAYRMERSFCASAGREPFYVRPMLVGAFHGRCPNLMEDKLCAIYDDRPLACRAYPAEINPFIEFNTANKKCPPESWQNGKAHDVGEPFIASNGDYQLEVRGMIEAARAMAIADVPRLNHLCGQLLIQTSAIAGEGFAAHSIAPDEFLAAATAAHAEAGHVSYHILSNQHHTVEVLSRCQVSCTYAPKDSAAQYGARRVTYLGLRDDQPAVVHEEKSVADAGMIKLF